MRGGVADAAAIAGLERFLEADFLAVHGFADVDVEPIVVGGHWTDDTNGIQVPASLASNHRVCWPPLEALSVPVHAIIREPLRLRAWAYLATRSSILGGPWSAIRPESREGFFLLLVQTELRLHQIAGGLRRRAGFDDGALDGVDDDSASLGRHVGDHLGTVAADPWTARILVRSKDTGRPRSLARSLAAWSPASFNVRFKTFSLSRRIPFELGQRHDIEDHGGVARFQGGADHINRHGPLRFVDGEEKSFPHLGLHRRAMR